MEQSLITLTVILSVFLGVFLLLAIVFLVKAIQIANRVKRISEKADHIALKLEGAAEFLQKTSGSLAIGKLLTKIADHLSDSKKTKKKKKKENS